MAHAKDVIKFDTYSEAISALLDLGESPNSEGTPLDDRKLSCKLFGDPPPADDTVDLPGWNSLSPSLQAHCNETIANTNSAAALGGGFGSTLTTRTVSQFDEQISATDQSDAANQTGDGRFNFGRGLELNLDDDRTFYSSDGSTIYGVTKADGRQSLSEQSPTGTVRWSSNSTAVFFTYQHDEIEREATKYQDGLKTESDRYMGGATIRLNENFAVGAMGYYGEGSGDYDGESSLFLGTGSEANINAVGFEQACGIKKGGEEDHHEYGGSLFGAYTGPDSWFVTNEFGAEKFKTKSKNNLCLLEANTALDIFPEPIRRVFRGEIEGEPEGYTLKEKLVIGRRFDFGFLSLSPRVGGEVAWTKVDSYEETENAITGAPRPSSDILPPDSADPNDTPRLLNQTGAALAYDDQEYLSVRSRLGFVAAIPIVTDDFAITPYGEAYYIHEFANDQEEIVARFAGDNREDPTYFSFKTNKPDRDYFELAGGLNVQAAAIPVEMAVGFRTIVGNSLYDYYQVEGGLRIPF